MDKSKLERLMVSRCYKLELIKLVVEGKFVRLYSHDAEEV